MNNFILEPNAFLNMPIQGYYNQLYTGFQQPFNPDFLNTLKNTFDSEDYLNLIRARNTVVSILERDIPFILNNEGLQNCICVCVPRAKTLSRYTASQLMFREAVSIASNNISGVVDGSSVFIRVQDTLTTHLRKSTNIINNGDAPYPGIATNTCYIDANKIMNQNVIIIDDIYTRTVNIDEDCIQALLDRGANRVIFYSIGYTKSSF